MHTQVFNVTSQAVTAVIAILGILLSSQALSMSSLRIFSVCTEVPPTVGMTNAIMKVSVEMLRILAIDQRD